jgi:predicted small secreted protein
MKRIHRPFGVTASLLVVAGLLATCVTTAGANDVQPTGKSIEEFISPRATLWL